MFGNAEKTTEVSLRMFDEEILTGTIIMGQSTSLDGILSRDTAFLEIEINQGERKFIAKNKIVSIDPKKPLKKPVLKNPISAPMSANELEAYNILDVPQDCAFDEVKNAYHKLIKVYHPDAYASQGLPSEVEEYMSNMLRQIIAAFDDISARRNAAA